MYIAYRAAIMLYEFYKRSLIYGKANEWVVLMNNSGMKKAGIGLCTFVGPYDQCAVFPAKVNRVNFKTYQITSEMQGLEVSVMIVWTIFREEDGPMRAYRMLGNDLKEAVPKTANDLCASLVSSVVRNQIANDTIDNIIKSRKEFRSKVMETMRGQMKGWGIWIESVEITDVKIMSGALFKDMQCVYRDDQYQIAQT
jgi:regulator of protease activity HflC (stomatin/prohibitin superfamily)